MKHYLFWTLLLASVASKAAWIEASGKVNSIAIYSSTETILVTLNSHGAPVTGCSNTSAFAVSNSMSPEGRARMYAMLLAAKTAGTVITVAYDELGGCEPWGSNQSVYRIIRRMR